MLVQIYEICTTEAKNCTTKSQQNETLKEENTNTEPSRMYFYVYWGFVI